MFSLHSGHMNTFASTPLPSELVSLLGSSLLGSGIRLLSFFMMAHHREHLMRLCRTRAIEHTVVSARKASGLQLTRRFIAFIAIFFVIAWPKLIAVFYPNIPISVGYSQRSGGFLFFSSAYEKLHWVQLNGLVITPLDTHLLSAIVGLYFGSALVDLKH